MSDLRLMCVLAHPDDESLGVGGTLARYAAEGVATTVVVATRGERGWPGDPAAYPGPRSLGEIREAELRAAARCLGIGSVEFLGYHDGELDRADPAEAVARIVAAIRRVQPHVVVTFGPDGAYGHPDHIAVSQLTTAAVVRAVDPAYEGCPEREPHRVGKLYYRVWTTAENDRFRAAFGETDFDVDGVARGAVEWPEWAITTRIDAASHWRAVRDAVACHRSQFPDCHPPADSTPAAVGRITDEQHQLLWGSESFYRAYSTVNGGRRLEQDLFAGLR